MPKNTFGDKLTLVQVMAWCCQAANDYKCCDMESLGHSVLIATRFEFCLDLPCFLGPILLTPLTYIAAWISNQMSSKVWDEITYRRPIFKGATIEVWEWISNYILHFIMDVITHPCWD